MAILPAETRSASSREVLPTISRLKIFGGQKSENSRSTHGKKCQIRREFKVAITATQKSRILLSDVKLKQRFCFQ